MYNTIVMSALFLSHPYLVYYLRILFSAFCGAAIGFERERRFKTAGIKTHIIVALSACLMMVISKYGFMDIIAAHPEIHVDISRIAASAVSAIGFLGAGVIFVRKESVSGVTTAAGLWATVGIGIAIGAGMELLGLATTVTIIILQLFLHKHTRLFLYQILGSITLEIPRSEFTPALLKDDFETAEIAVRSMDMSREADDLFIVKLQVSFPKNCKESDIMNLFKDKPFIKQIEYYQATQ